MNSSNAHTATPDDACAVLEWEDAPEPQAEVGEVENAVGLATITAWIDSTAPQYWEGGDDHATAAVTVDPGNPYSRG